MKPITSPVPSTARDPHAINSQVRAPIILFMLKRCIIFGVLVGAVAGTYTGSDLIYGVPGGRWEVLVMGFVFGAAAGFFLGALLGFVDALALIVFAPLVHSGKLRLSVSAALASAAAVVLVLGAALLVVADLWVGTILDPTAVAACAVATFVGGTWFGISALYSTLNPPPSWLPPRPAGPAASSEDE